MLKYCFRSDQRGMKTTLHYFTGITATCLQMVSGLAWQANVDNNQQFSNIRKSFSNIENYLFINLIYFLLIY